jgi:hypothetical protein
MQDQDVFRWMKRFGYLPEVEVKDIGKLDSRSAVASGGLRLLQSAVYTESQIGLTDGVLGDRTRAALLQPRCGHPDFADPELADVASVSSLISAGVVEDKEDAISLINMHERLFEMQKAIGSGSWPMPCQKEGITVSWDTSRAPRELDTDKLFDEVAKAYQDIGANVIKGSGQANIRVWWEVLAGSTIGIAQFNSQRCSDSVFCKLDPGYFPNFMQVGQLLKHEWGHNMNLQHTNGGTMNPSITQATTLAWTKNDPSYRTLERFFGGEPIDPPDPPEPPPIPTGEGEGMIFYGGVPYEIKQSLKKL